MLSTRKASSVAGHFEKSRAGTLITTPPCFSFTAPFLERGRSPRSGGQLRLPVGDSGDIGLLVGTLIIIDQVEEEQREQKHLIDPTEGERL